VSRAVFLSVSWSFCVAVGGLKKLFSLREIEDADDEVESAVSERERDGMVGSVWRDSGAISSLPEAPATLRGESGSEPSLPDAPAILRGAAPFKSVAMASKRSREPTSFERCEDSERINFGVEESTGFSPAPKNCAPPTCRP
jgi:hypothetical protein